LSPPKHLLQRLAIKPRTTALRMQHLLKSLTMTRALTVVLARYFTFMVSGVSTSYSHNVLADELIRFTVPLSTLDPIAQLTIPWRDLLCSSGIQVTQVGRKWPSNFAIRLREKYCCSPLTGCLHRLVLGEFLLRLVDCRYVWCSGNSPPKKYRS